ncbi:hypothetical protein U1Q18_031736 [Sarracenia purpurea var. burkii]
MVSSAKISKVTCLGENYPVKPTRKFPGSQQGNWIWFRREEFGIVFWPVVQNQWNQPCRRGTSAETLELITRNFWCNCSENQENPNSVSALIPWVLL